MNKKKTRNENVRSIETQWKTLENKVGLYGPYAGIYIQLCIRKPYL